MILSKRAKEILKVRREIRDMKKAGYMMLTPNNTSIPLRVVKDVRISGNGTFVWAKVEKL